ncbi:MAG: Pyrophosphate-energized proton pump [uncultured Thermomicrobiales bacterium]|uniref:K(+)-insensitive pyrophosphate-energized proton pump n=1 Tax=uncultured Thermomicrobiales bacterium TaxID=1645740 RepID=A0A6J4USC8_9BACT|nr:MAG: Pyrophosphate-energized proton pump [uncultured Thermomicrobiales bacterium]
MDRAVLFSLPVVILGVLAILYSGWLARDVFSRDTGTAEMQDIAGRIFQGAIAYLRRQYGTIARLAIVVALLIGLLVFLFERENQLTRGVITSVAFLLGALLSGLAGWIGMYVAVRSNVRTAAAARNNLGSALTVALRGGAVSGFLVVALGLLGVLSVFWVVYRFVPADADLTRIGETPFWIVGFAFGASFVALFAQLGGGIYTKAADVGADLVGKVEAGIPEDDPRNPAVIADLVGDNVGDCAGRGADIFESSVAEMIGAMILGAALFLAAGGNPDGPEVGFLFFPLVVTAFGLVASYAAVMAVRPAATPADPMDELNKGFYVAAGLSAVLIVLASFWVLPFGKLEFALCGLIGIATSLAFVYITQYYTSARFRPVKSIMEASQTGPATNIISGIAVGFETTGLPAIAIAISLLSAFALGQRVEFPGDFPIPGSAGIFGTACATMGMLMSAAYILAMDTFGPITDNAGGVVEMSDQPESVRDVTDALDSAGNTTKALTKGYAVGTAALAAFLLFFAFLQEIERFGGEAVDTSVVNLSDPPVFIGGLFGAMLVFVFASLAMRAVSRAAGDMIAEVRRQFREDPGIMAGTSQPDYASCVDISVRASLREMVLPGVLAVAVPILVGVILGWQAAAGMLLIGTITGVLVANILNNGGGAWDNAKKMIEAGHLKDAATGAVLGKGSAPHAASVVGDTVGDPWKDTAGPSLHVLIKLLATITLVLAPLFL